MVAVPIELLWAFIGLILTIIGTLVKAFMINPPFHWSLQGLHAQYLGASFQIGAVLLVGCMGGKNAGALSQIAYVALGLAGFQIFNEGGGINYFREPSFGYLLGFVPGAWICGSMAFKAPPKLETLSFSCLCGLLTIHIAGLVYLILAYTFRWVDATAVPLFKAISIYSFYLLPGQLAIVCAVAVLAFTLRRLMFY